MYMRQRNSILFLLHDASVLEVLVTAVKEDGWDALVAENTSSARDLLTLRRADIAVLVVDDETVGNDAGRHRYMPGVVLVARALGFMRNANIPFVLLMGLESEELCERVHNAGGWSVAMPVRLFLLIAFFQWLERDHWTDRPSQP